MKKKKVKSAHSNSEIVRSFVFPIKLTAKQKEEAAQQLREARNKLKEKSTKEDDLMGKILQFKFQMENWIKSEQYDPNKRFGDFLKSYLSIIRKKRNQFAEEIKIHETLLSQMINNKREPSQNIIVRLEMHSNKSIPAEYWYKLVQKDHIHELKSNSMIRQREKKYVTNRISVKV